MSSTLPEAPRHVAIRIKRLPHAKDLPLPRGASSHASGLDVSAAIDDHLTLAPGDRGAVATGLCVEIPPGYEIQVRPRSGLALKQGITVLNTPGTVDADFRGEIKVILVNHGFSPVTIKRGDRIAQLVLAPVIIPVLEEVDELSATERDAGGFGSTGV